MGLALFYAAGISMMLVMAWFFRRLGRSDVRVAETQGLVASLIAVGGFGMGLSLISLSSAPLIPLAIGIIALSVAIGAYGVKLFRSRP